jgi:hypothetical protein
MRTALLLAVLDRREWREDMPRLVRGTLGRQQAGHWNTTVANAWGVSRWSVLRGVRVDTRHRQTVRSLRE